MRSFRAISSVTVAVASAVTVIAAGLIVVPALAATPNHLPQGSLDSAVQSGVGFRVVGWVRDADTSKPVRIKVRVDGKVVAKPLANIYRPDVVHAHPTYSAYLGYDVSHAATVGTHKVCVSAVDYPTGVAHRIRCVSLTIAVNPFGTVTSLTRTPGFVHVSGWAIDPDVTPQASTVRLRIDGVRVASAKANATVAGLAAKYLTAGAKHGYSISAPISEGTHSVCVRILNAGKGSKVTLPCRTVSVNDSPTGAISAVTQTPGGVSVTGYASDPDTTAPIDVTITAGGVTLGTVLANGTNATRPGHGFRATFAIPGAHLAAGVRTICALGRNLGVYGTDRNVQCVSHSFNWNPSVGVETVVQRSPGANIVGWAVDPDTSAAIDVNIIADGQTVATVPANKHGRNHGGHRFTATVPLPDGTHRVCAVAVNTLYGSANSPMTCQTVRLKFEPYGSFWTLNRAPKSTNVVATGWAIDPDTTAPINVTVAVDGGAPVTQTANISRPDVAAKYPGTGTRHGYAVSVPASAGEHQVCVRAVNVLGGSGSTSLGCKVINAVHPKVPAAPTSVSAVAGYGGARIVWTAPRSDGGAPWSKYTITASPGGKTMSVAGSANGATLLGLKPSTKYTFSVVAINVAGASGKGTSPAATTEKEPPAQTSPAPVSTSRYIRNIHNNTTADLPVMRKEGATDAKNNPSGHGYLVLLDIGGQVESEHGVILSAGIRFVSYTTLVRDLEAYVAGYASQQRPSAPITIALGTNNDIDVSKSSGAHWADLVVDPVATFAAQYTGITIAGANDIEPGFRASYTSTRNWLQGYLHATHAPFVFNGSADGCAWTAINRSCNNGWSMSKLFQLAGGANSARILNLPQIYNSTMAKQWRYISLTGVAAGKPKIHFGGALTEYTACRQAGSCGSIGGNNAWRQMWAQLRSAPQLKPASLPYSTDLRIDS